MGTMKSRLSKIAVLVTTLPVTSSCEDLNLPCLPIKLSQAVTEMVNDDNDIWAELGKAGDKLESSIYSWPFMISALKKIFC